MNAHAFPVRADEATVRTFLDIVHQQAAHALQIFDQPGDLQLVCIHPVSGAVVSTRFRIGDVDRMVRAALDAAASGHNGYVETRTIKAAASGTGRGGIDDTGAVFAFVVDSDADKGKAGTLTVQPSLVVETSPGNAHHWFFLDRALPPNEAQLLGAAIRAATGADSATGVVTQPYRVAGTPNFPSASKRARGRAATPTRILASDGPLWSKDELLAAFPIASSSGPGGGQRTVEALVAEIAMPAMD